MKITTILQLYKRPQYLKEQIEAIKKQTLPSKIIAVHNEGGIKFDYPKEIEHVIYSSKNLKFHLRYAVALLADSEYISIFDDDTIPQPEWYQNCLDTIAKFNCICVSNGRIVDRANKKQYGMGWGVPNEIPMKVDFGGHSLFFKREVLKYMFYDAIQNFQTGEDIQLSANALIYGGVKTYVPPHPVNNRSVWGADPEKSAKYGSDENSEWIVRRNEHTSERFQLFEYYIKKGWKLILEENSF